MASEVSYTPVAYVNDQAPQLNATAMNLKEAALKGCADRAINQTIATALNASTIVAGTQWGSGNDGNEGVAPYPKATSGNESLTAATPKTLVTLASADACYLVDVFVAGGGGGYRSMGMVHIWYGGSGGAIYTPIYAGANLALSISGFDLQATCTASAGCSWYLYNLQL